MTASSATEVYGLMLTTMSRPDEGSFTKSCWTCGAWTIRKSRSTAPLCPAQNRFATPFLSKRLSGPLSAYTLCLAGDRSVGVQSSLEETLRDLIPSLL